MLNASVTMMASASRRWATSRFRAKRIVATLGEKPFHGYQGMNPAVFDAVFTVIAKRSGALPADLKDRRDALVDSEEFKASASYRTTDVEAVKRRLELARNRLFDAQ